MKSIILIKCRRAQSTVLLRSTTTACAMVSIATLQATITTHAKVGVARTATANKVVLAQSPPGFGLLWLLLCSHWFCVSVLLDVFDANACNSKWWLSRLYTTWTTCSSKILLWMLGEFRTSSRCMHSLECKECRFSSQCINNRKWWECNNLCICSLACPTSRTRTLHPSISSDNHQSY